MTDRRSASVPRTPSSEAAGGAATRVDPPPRPSRRGPTGTRLFRSLGVGIVRHPWYPILFWVLLLILAVPAITHVGSVTTNSATTLPNSAPSVRAQNEIDRLYPSQSGGSSTYVMLTTPNVTGAVGQRATLAVAGALAADGSLQYVSGVDSYYSAYQQYLAGQAELGLGFLSSAVYGPDALLTGVNDSAALVWSPASVYFRAWSALVDSGNYSAPGANYPAYENAVDELAGAPPSARLVLDAFYFGNASDDVTGFNATVPAACGGNSSAATLPCAIAVERATFPTVVPALGLSPENSTLPLYVLGALDLTNFTSWPSVRGAAADLVAAESGLGGAWLDTVWAQFPALSASSAELGNWSGGVANGTPADYPLPVPASISTAFLNPGLTSTLILVSFSVSDDFTEANGSDPVYSDLLAINALVPKTLDAAAPGAGIRFVQTGPAYLDQNENSLLDRDIAFILPVTVGILILITMLYFRAPMAPILTFGAIGIALGLGLGAVYLIGKYVTAFDVTSLTLVDTFVLGVGTDYSVFLVARYREELVRGATPDEAVVTTVTWAGESIATSGATVIVATLAMAFSGIALLSQWGIALSVSVLLTLLLALTVTPALLRLFGPRLFWPYTKDRFRRTAEKQSRAIRDGRTYFHRAGRMATRRSKTVIGLILLVSVPLVLVAIAVPLSYNFYAQLPSSQPAASGLRALESEFGPGYVFPTVILVTFESPLLVGNATNATEFTEASAVQGLMESTAGVARVDSLLGESGAPLATWLNYSALPPAQRINLEPAVASFVGSDGRTVWYTVTPSSDGLSNAAVDSLNRIEGSVNAYAAAHPAVTSVAYGGAASTIKDLATQTSEATERMILAATIGLFLVLFLVLGSVVIPPIALATIGLSISWAYALSYLLIGKLQGAPIFFFVPTILFVLILGLGMDYNVFLLTRVREERLKHGSTRESVVHAVTYTGGVITAAAVILASAFLVLGTSSFTLLEAIGLAVGLAVLLDALIVRTYLVPAAISLAGERVWWGWKRLQRQR